MGAGGGPAASIGSGILSVFGQNKAQDAYNKGNMNAQNALGTPPIFWKGGPWWEALTGPNNLLAQNAVSLLKGNGANELQPALRSADIAGRNRQGSFAAQLAKSGLTGSGFGMGGNYAIGNQTDVNKQNILAQLPQLQRENLAALAPYFSRYLSNQEFRSGGLSALKNERGRTNAAATANKWATVGSALGGVGAKGGGGSSPYGGGGGGGKGGGGK